MTVTLQPAATDGPFEVTARYLVGADGGRSTVRSMLGIAVEELGSEGDHLSALFRADLSAVMPGVPYVLAVTVAPGAEGLFATTGTARPLDLRHRVASGGGGDPRRLAGRADGRADPRGLGPARSPAGDHRHLPVVVRGVGRAPAAVVGRVFLVGDAAHRTTPRGATGMNTGIADGHNLGLEAGLGGPWLGGAVAARLVRVRAGAESAGPTPRRRCSPAWARAVSTDSIRTSESGTPRVR